jgi:allantoicase
VVFVIALRVAGEITGNDIGYRFFQGEYRGEVNDNF